MGIRVGICGVGAFANHQHFSKFDNITGFTGNFFDLE